jgi:hypothetical protein
MTTVSKIMLDVRALLDELSKKGVQIPEINVIDMQTSGVRLVDMAQKELFKSGNIYATYEFTQKNPTSLINAMDLNEFTGTDKTFNEDGVLAKSYYFEADDDGIAVIEELEGGTWVPLIYVTITSSDKMNAYKGLITPTTVGNLIRIRFTGATYYKFQNVALFSEPFKVGKIPNYGMYSHYVMPSNFRLTDVVVEETPLYNISSRYKWEGFNTLIIDYDFVGKIKVIYKPVPVTITTINDELQLDDITVNAITYYVAARIAPHEMAELTNFFEDKYNQLKLESMKGRPATEQPITDVYGVIDYV